MVTWTQMYMPMGGLGLSALVALIPIIFFFVALAVLRLKGHVAGAITLILSILIAIFAFKMPIDMAFAAAGYGFIYGLWPIAWIIVAAVFLYKLTVASGQFDIIRSSVISITDDQRLQVLLIGFSFGALLEGAAGFGAPVAITGALLVGLGFKPLYAAGLCLIANTAPVAFGALGVPILVAGQVTGIDPFHIGAMAGRQLPFLSVLVPFWLVAMMDGWKGVKETWPAALVAGGSFAVTQFFTSNYIGPELPDITSALVSIVSLALFLKVWRPKNTETAISMGQSAGAMVVNKPSSGGPVPSEYSLGQIIRAWSPFLILTVLVTIWTMKPFKALFAPGGAFYSLVINFQIPHLHQQVLKAAPIVAQPTPMDAVFKFDPLSAGGTAIFIAAIISIFILGVGIKKGIGVFAETLISLKWPILSIGMVLAFAFVTNYSGMSTTLALVLAGNHGGVMALFYYQALERNGRKTKGMIEADSARHARQLLRGKELIPVHIEARMNTSSGGMLQRRRHAHRRVAAADLALFTRQLATLVQAAMPLETCLQAVSEQSEKLHVKSLGMALRSRIQEGYTLSDSLREHPRVFDSLFCSMVAAGEKSGHLDVVLNRLADYTEQRQRLKSRLLQAMLYPLVLLVVATGVVTILLTAVVPKIIEQFDHLGHALPASTRTLIAMSDALQASGVYWLAGLLGLLVLGQRLLKNPAMRLRWDQTVLRLPVTGRVARGLNTARFSRTLSILTASSVPLLEGIQTAAAVSANRYVEQQLLLAADRVREGSSLRAALAELRLFPPMMLYMIASGEQSGELETMLEQAAVNQEREFDTQVGLALGLFEPALVVMMAGVVLFIVIAILEPMLQLNNMVGM